MTENLEITQPGTPEFPEPTDDERSSAMLPHILQVFGSFFAPLIIFLVKRNSRYVRFHALQALIWQVLATLATILTFIGFFVAMFMSFSSMPQGPNAPVPKALFFFPLIWLVFMAQYAISILLAIVFGIQCSKGRWSRYPLIGGLALRWSK
ncbi:MAG: hypothetical protein JWO13_2936 [Acidobacteriales bacterium]|nr:hypothetical protein [Terriglobales bacterium]